MIYPTVEQLAGKEFNRYELVVGVAKCARIVTDEYVEMKAKAQQMIENHETDKPLSALIDPEYKDQKAVKIAISKLMNGRFKMVHPKEETEDTEEIEETEANEVSEDTEASEE